jgi:hypothetical protein
MPIFVIVRFADLEGMEVDDDVEIGPSRDVASRTSKGRSPDVARCIDTQSGRYQFSTSMTVLLSANPHELESANRCINHRVLGWLCKNYSRILILSKLIDVEINVYGKWGLQARRSSSASSDIRGGRLIRQFMHQAVPNLT